MFEAPKCPLKAVLLRPQMGVDENPITKALLLPSRLLRKLGLGVGSECDPQSQTETYPVQTWSQPSSGPQHQRWIKFLDLSAPKSQRFLRFAIAMPIADPRNRAISETRQSNAALWLNSGCDWKPLAICDFELRLLSPKPLPSAGFLAIWLSQCGNRWRLRLCDFGALRSATPCVHYAIFIRY